MTTRNWVITVAISCVVFAWVGVTADVALMIAAFLVVVLISKPRNWQEWFILVSIAFAASPWLLFASMISFKLGVTSIVALVSTAFLVSALITKPGKGQEWLVLLLIAFATYPFLLFALWLFSKAYWWQLFSY